MRATLIFTRIIQKPDRKTVIHLILFSSLLVLFFSVGGLFVLLSEDRVQLATTEITLLGTVAATAFLGVFLCCRFLSGCRLEHNQLTRTTQRKQLAFSLILFILLVAGTLLLMNIAASFYVAPWPMRGLHGVSSAVGEKAWSYHEKADHFVKVNSWGQRDREHTVTPQPGTYRMIFIGDSFLESGAAVPLPFRTEEILKRKGQQSRELINLGVSGTAPDEYYYRLKRIGLPLKPDHCVMFFYAGNDFIQEPTLLSFGGISATYPRWSFLQALGLNSLDHVINNDRRPVLRAWFYGGALLDHELELKELFAKTVDDQATERMYLSFFPQLEQAQLKSVLDKSSKAERSRFYEILRRPDDGQFRSYNLDSATKVAKGTLPEFVPAEYSFRWIEAASALCRSKGVKFTLVIIPEGFTVDSRMTGQYSALADMKTFVKPKDEAVSRLASHALEAEMDVIDLRDLLKQAPGAYLNMDGHWSQYGVDIIAGFLAERFEKKHSSNVRD